jgi:hypothetical protein
MTFKRVDMDRLKVECFRGIVNAINEAYAEIDRLIRGYEDQRTTILLMHAEAESKRREIDGLTTLADSRLVSIEYQQLEIDRLNQVIGQRDDAIDRLNQIVAKPIVPVFDVGKLYRNGHGDLCRFDRRTDPVGEYVYQSTFIERPGIGSWHKQDGRGQFDRRYDLIFPAVDPPPTWVPWPWLPDGKYVAEGNFVSIPGTNECHTISLSRKLRGYTSDPPEGIWEVTGPGKAVYRRPLK